MEFTSSSNNTPSGPSTVAGMSAGESINSNSISYAPHELYGGAMSVTLPSTFLDASQFREVPDHQEVFVHKENDVSMMVELLDYESEKTDDEAVRYLFEDLAKCNEAISSTIYSTGYLDPSKVMPGVDPSFPRLFLCGKQVATKFKTKEDSEYDEVFIFFAVLRLHNVRTEVLVSFNVPFHSVKEGQDANSITSALVEQYLQGNSASVLSDTVVAGGATAVGTGEGIGSLVFDLQQYKSFYSSLNVHDWSLFVNS